MQFSFSFSASKKDIIFLCALPPGRRSYGLEAAISAVNQEINRIQSMWFFSRRRFVFHFAPAKITYFSALLAISAVNKHLNRL